MHVAMAGRESGSWATSRDHLAAGDPDLDACLCFHVSR
jgi:hypothetical protein